MLGPVAAASRPIRSIVHSAYRRFELGMCSAMVMEGHDQGLAVLKKGGGFKMSIEPEGWHIGVGPPAWDAEAKTFSFFLHKPGRERVSWALAIAALEQTVQSSDLSIPALTKIFDAHRQMIELRGAQKLNAGLLDPDGAVVLGAGDI
ncbi:MAG: hypothetical protein WB678_18795 [Stellaceae bacterium]